MNIQRRQLLAVTAAATLCAPALHASPQAAANWPTKPIRLVVPNMAGGGMDLLARTMQEKLQEIWGQQILVDCKPGAGTVLGTDLVAKSPPDGYTLGMVA